jgi:hypothetical protein
MSFEINPVLAGTFDADHFPSALSNINPASRPSQTNATDTASGTSNVADSRRYTQFDRSTTDAGSTTDFSFSDLLDTVNPLQHIPVVSSIYRAVTGEKINPVARVAGDILYGGMLGGVSALAGGVGGVADAALESQTGKDSGGLVVASLFGDDDKSDDQKTGEVQVAQNTISSTSADTDTTVDNAEPPSSAAPATLASAATNNPASKNMANIPVNSSGANAPATPSPTAIAAAISSAVNAASGPTSSAVSAVTDSKNTASSMAGTGMIPLAQAKGTLKPFGGAMGQPNAEAQNMAIALSSASPGMRLGHTIYTNPLINGQHPLALAAKAVPPNTDSSAANNAANSAAPSVATSPVPTMTAVTATKTTAATPTTGTTANTVDGLPKGLLDDIAALKAINQYKGIGSNTPSSAALGTNLSIMN